jgi:hypothetical protein
VIDVYNSEDLTEKYGIKLLEKVPIEQKFKEAFKKAKKEESLKFLFE